MRQLFSAFIFLALGLCYWIYQQQVDNFSCQDVYLTLWPKKEYGAICCKLTVDQTRTILDQPFRYLTKGRQFYVFESHDGKYVLKLLKCQRINVSGLYKSVPLPAALQEVRRKRLEQKQKRIDSIFSSCLLAATTLQPVTGVCFVHLTTSKELKKKVRLVDRVGVSHILELDQIPFVLQLKAKSVLPTLSHALKNSALQEVDKRLQQLVDLVVYDAQHQIMDIDDGAIIRDNTAFLEDSAIHADIGTLTFKADTLTNEHLQYCFRRYDPIIHMLEQEAPSLADSFRDKMKQALLLVPAA